MINPNDHVGDYVDQYVQDLLSSEHQSALRQHCQECQACQSALEEAQHRLAVLQSVPACEATEPVTLAHEHYEEHYDLG